MSTTPNPMLPGLTEARANTHGDPPTDLISLERLPEELLDWICALCDDSCEMRSPTKPDLCSIALVSKKLCRITRPHIYRNIIIDETLKSRRTQSKDFIVELTDSLKGAHGFGPMVKHLSIEDFAGTGTWFDYATLIDSCPNLISLYTPCRVLLQELVFLRRGWLLSNVFISTSPAGIGCT